MLRPGISEKVILNPNARNGIPPTFDLHWLKGIPSGLWLKGGYGHIPGDMSGKFRNFAGEKRKK